MTKLQLLSPALDWVPREDLDELFCPYPNLYGETKVARFFFPPLSDFLLLVLLVLTGPAQSAWSPDATQTLRPSGMKTASLFLSNVSPHWEGGACLVEITLYREGESWLHHSQHEERSSWYYFSYSPLKHSGFFSLHSLHIPHQDLLLFTEESKVTCS